MLVGARGLPRRAGGPLPRAAGGDRGGPAPALRRAHPRPPVAAARAARERPGRAPLLRGLVLRDRHPRALAAGARGEGLERGGLARGAAARAAPRVRARRGRAPTATSCRPPSRCRRSGATSAGPGCARAPPPGCRGRRRTCAPRSCAGCARVAARTSRPLAADAMLLGGTIFEMLEREAGVARGGRARHRPARPRRRARCSSTRSGVSWWASSATGARSSTRCRRPEPPAPAERSALRAAYGEETLNPIQVHVDASLLREPVVGLQPGTM